MNKNLFAFMSVITMLLCGCAHSDKTDSSQPAPFTIVEHHMVPATADDLQRDEYTVRHGDVLLRVRYSESQTSTAKPGDYPGSGLHLHQYYSNPDLSQVPEIGKPIRQCNMSKTPDENGSYTVIAIQPTPEPCMVATGDNLRYEPSPNGPEVFTYVNFDIVEEHLAGRRQNAQ